MKRIPLALVLACCAAPAWAQSSLPSPSAAIGGKASQPAPSAPAPAALPGARAEPTAVAPITRNAVDLPPNEALFDAVNRGDLAVAKDAVNRGADLDAKNILGLTPIELAVDLGRNQISFYLLSMRGGGMASTGATQPAPPKPPSRAERLAAQRAERAERAQPVVADAAPAAPRTARLFVGGGGTPVPQAGFLGFDAPH